MCAMYIKYQEVVHLLAVLRRGMGMVCHHPPNLPLPRIPALESPTLQLESNLSLNGVLCVFVLRRKMGMECTPPPPPGKFCFGNLYFVQLENDLFSDGIRTYFAATELRSPVFFCAVGK